MALTTMLVGGDVGAQGVREFGVMPGKLPIRGFGNPHGEEALRIQFPDAAASIVGDDRSLARKQISIADANADGMVTQKEWAESGFQTPERFPIYDLNGDGILTFYEHCIGIAAWRRRTERRSDANRSAQEALARSRATPITSTAALKEAPQVDPQVVARQEQTQQLADYLVAQYDVNENRVIERVEFQSQTSPLGNIAGADRDRDGKIVRDEIDDWLQSRLPPLSRLAMDLQSRDRDHDDQLTFSEFATVIDRSSVDEFARRDRNGDGLITPAESYAPQVASSMHENGDSLVIKPNASVVSSIWIEDETMIDRLQVNVNVVKENDDYTALFLVGPEGKRVTLYAGNGWRPWHGALILKGVTFHDAAPLITSTLKQPPYRRELRPPQIKDAMGLRTFAGQSARGIWRLIVRNQNDRPGLLIHWSLVVTPKRKNG